MNVAGATSAASKAATHAMASIPKDVDVIIVGNGIVGSTLAIDLAQRGISTHVIEKYGEVATRRNLFNLAPAVGDRLAALDKGTGELTDVLVPIQQLRFDDRVVGGTPRIRAGSDFFHEQVLNPGLRGLLDGMSAPPEDTRLLSRTRIEEIENAARGYAAKHHPDMVSTSYNSQLSRIANVSLEASADAQNPVGGLVDSARGVLELLPKGQDSIEVGVRGADGVESAVRGKYLIFATGGRNPLGIKPDLSKDVMYFAGAEFPATPTKPVVANRIREWSDKIPGAVDREVNSEHRPLTTIGLTYPKDRSIVWAELGHDPKSIEPGKLKEILAERAKFVDIPGDMIGEPIPVKVQLGSVDRAAFPDQRVALVGDELGPPYFPTSTGAAKGIAVSGPLLADAIEAALKPGADSAAIMREYERAALHAHEVVQETSTAQVTHDLHELGKDLPYDLPRTGVLGQYPK